jgi:creatinine deaminase
MARAIEEARISRSEGGIPIGASLVAADGAILAGGHNRRVQHSSPTLHAEIDCLERAGRQRSYVGMTLYTTLVPCYMCAGAIVQFEIPEVVVGEARTFPGARDWLQSRGVRVRDLDIDECYGLLQGFIAERPDVWLEDIGGPGADASPGSVLNA